MAFDAFVHEGDALLRAGQPAFLLRFAFGRREAGHEAHDVFKLVVAMQRAEDVTERRLLRRSEF